MTDTSFSRKKKKKALAKHNNKQAASVTSKRACRSGQMVMGGILHRDGFNEGGRCDNDHICLPRVHLSVNILVLTPYA